MQKLVRAGILRGVRGPRGGYLLAREKRRITVADICAALAEEDEIPASTPLGAQVVGSCHPQIPGIATPAAGASDTGRPA